MLQLPREAVEIQRLASICVLIKDVLIMYQITAYLDTNMTEFGIKQA